MFTILNGLRKIKNSVSDVLDNGPALEEKSSSPFDKIAEKMEKKAREKRAAEVEKVLERQRTLIEAAKERNEERKRNFRR